MQGINGEDYLLSLDYSDPYTYAVLIHDLSSDTYLKLILDDALNTAEFGSGRFMRLTDLTNTMSHVSTVTKLLMNQYEISKEAGELREEVMSNPRLSEDEPAGCQHLTFGHNKKPLMERRIFHRNEF